MNFDKLRSNIVGKCEICGGTGIKETTITDVKFCDCYKFLLFLKKGYDQGFPIQYSIQYEPPEVDLNKKICFYFKDERTAFFHSIRLFKDLNLDIRVFCSSKMWDVSDFDFDGFILYGIGLETFQNNSLQLIRIMNEAVTRGVYAIFSFYIPYDKIDFHYHENVKLLINKIYEL